MSMIPNTHKKIFYTQEIYLKGPEKVNQKRNEIKNCLILINTVASFLLIVTFLLKNIKHFNLNQ